MDNCRICLSSKRNLRSVFESTSDGNSFVAMMKTLANVVIVKNDGSPQKLCQICCNKLVAAYSFKTQIERSEEVLQNSASSKKICFSNLQDIKIEILDVKETIPKYESAVDDYFKDGESSTFYNDTIIKKIETVEVIKKEPLSVIDYLNNFTADSDQDFHDDIDFATPQSDNEDHEYMLPLSKRKKRIKRKKLRNFANTDYVRHSDNEDPDFIPLGLEKVKKKSKEVNIFSGTIKKPRQKARKRGKLRKVLIKPVILKDIQVLRTKEKENTSKVKKRCKPGKLDMCTYCGMMFRSIKTHMLTHTGEKQYKCDICNKSFYTEKNLRKHKTAHDRGKIFKCNQCVAAFIFKESLKRHVIIHSEEKSYVCDICNKCFKRSRTRDRHKMMHNLANKCIKCELCNMSFFTRDQLKHHMRVHTGERPYKCELCSQPYSYKHDFNRHCLKKHGIFLKRRLVNVMNEEVLNRERALMKDLMTKMNSAGEKEKLLNRFEGPRPELAFEMAIKAMKTKQINVDY